MIRQHGDREHVGAGVRRRAHQHFRRHIRQLVFAGLLPSQLLLAHRRQHVLHRLDARGRDDDPLGLIFVGISELVRRSAGGA